VWAEIGVGKPFLHISGMYGPERGCLAMVWPLAPHPTNKNELIVWDLQADPNELFTLGAAAIRERMFTRSDELPVGVTRLPIKTIHINKSPVVIGNLKTLTPALAERWGIDVAQCLAHAEVAAQKGVTMAGIWPDVFHRPAPDKAPDVDEDLYGGFLGPQDRSRLDRLRRTRPDDPAMQRASFDDPRLNELFFRWRARNFAHTLAPGEVERWTQLRVARLLHGEGGGLSLDAFHEQLRALGVSADERGHEILSALADYARAITPA
jgi:exodeoxyribonuclease-1